MYDFIQLHHSWLLDVILLAYIVYQSIRITKLEKDKRDHNSKK